MAEDWADHHVERWRDHWIDVPFDDEVEAMWVRMGRLIKHLRRGKQDAVRAVGLEDFQYDTLHNLMIRDTPGLASPTALAEDLGVSPAGMTGRLDAMEKAGWLRRGPSPDDRRRVEVEATKAGVQIWRDAMAGRERDELAIAGALTPKERAALNRLLKKMTLAIEEGRG